MEVFNITINQMLVLFGFIAVGIFLSKKGLLADNASKVLSKLETYIFLPCLSFKTFYSNCTLPNFISTSKFVLYGTAVMLASFLIGILLSKLFTKDKYIRNVYVYSFTIPNLGFMGNAIVLGIFGEEALFQYMMFHLPFQIFIYTYGLYSLIPSENGGKIEWKKLINPPLMGILLGAVFGLCQIPLPDVIMTALTSASACMSPVAMLIAGCVIGAYSIKKLAGDPKIYIASFIRLMVMPIAFVLVLRLLNTDELVVRAALCATALPFGLNTVVFPEAYGGDSTPGASLALVSHFLSVITLSINFALFL